MQSPTYLPTQVHAGNRVRGPCEHPRCGHLPRHSSQDTGEDLSNKGTPHECWVPLPSSALSAGAEWPALQHDPRWGEADCRTRAVPGSPGRWKSYGQVKSLDVRKSHGQLMSPCGDVRQSHGQLTSPCGDVRQSHGQVMSPCVDARKCHDQVTSTRIDRKKSHDQVTSCYVVVKKNIFMRLLFVSA